MGQAKVVERGPVSITLEGKAYTGRYEVTGGKLPFITVWYNGKSKATQVGGSTPKDIGEFLLWELVTDDLAINPKR